MNQGPVPAWEDALGHRWPGMCLSRRSWSEQDSPEGLLGGGVKNAGTLAAASAPSVLPVLGAGPRCQKGLRAGSSAAAHGECPGQWAPLSARPCPRTPRPWPCLPRAGPGGPGVDRTVFLAEETSVADPSGPGTECPCPRGAASCPSAVPCGPQGQGRGRGRGWRPHLLSSSCGCAAPGDRQRAISSFSETPLVGKCTAGRHSG